MKLKLGEGLQIPIEVAGQAVALVGIRGSGKTNTAGVIAEELLDRGQQIVVLDPTDAWWGLRSDYPVFIFGGPHGDLPLNETDGKTLAEFVVQEKVPIILSLRHLRKGAQRRLVMEFCEELYHLKGKPEYREPLTVFIDEAPQFVPQRVMGEMARLVGAVQDMILLGRSAGFGVVMISQRFATLNADVRTQADTVIVHRLPSPLDRKALTEWIEENATISEQKEVLSSLAKLATGEAWVWSPYFDLFKRSQIRPRRTFDSSAAPKRGAPARTPNDLTKVDLEKLKGKMAATIEKAKADDPRELRKQVAELKAQLAKGAAQAIPKTEPIPIRQVDKPVLTDADRVLLDKLTGRIESAFALHHEDLVLANQRLQSALHLVGGEYAAAVTATTGRAQTNLQALFEAVSVQKLFKKLAAAAPASPPLSSTASRLVSKASITPVSVKRAPTVDGDASIGNSGLSRMLVALAQRPQGLRRNQLGLRAMVSTKGGSFNTYLSKARVNGWVDTSGDRIRITDAGLAALGSYEPLPEGRALLEHYLRDLGSSGAGRMLQAIADVYPSALTRADLSERSSVSAAGGSFNTYLSKLRTLELVEGKTELRAAEELFS